MQVSYRRIVILCVLALLASLPGAAASPVAAQAIPTTGWFGSQQAIATPLQPVSVQVSLPNYSGPASLLVFDPAGKAVGTWDFTVTNGQATVQVTPRGALGEHWAALFASGQQVASGTLYRLDASTTVRTGVEKLDLLYSRVRGFMVNARLSYYIDGHLVQGYRSPDSPLLWLRDHYYQGRGFRYFDQDVTSLLDAFRREQQPDGSFPDYVDRPAWNITAARTPVEADVEYLFVQAVFEAWRMSGDDAWLRSNLPAMQAAMNYTLSDPLRWEPTLGLVKRPFTIDTWDFEYGPTTTDPHNGQPAPRHWIDDQTIWGIFHGDNTGVAQALNSLALIEDYLGQPENAQYHRNMAAAIMARLNALSWNGSFFRHHVKLVPFDVPGVDEERQLSLSNAIALNRRVLTVEQGRAILNEYQSRRATTPNPSGLVMHEWWSINPPFPSGSFGMAGRQGENPGEYTNGGLMPLVGGELARGAFRHGYEKYGFNILERYYALIDRTNSTFLWYYPTGAAGVGTNDTIPTDGWGASAMLGALMEGAAGVEDIGIRYSEAIISPRWIAAEDEITSAYVAARYAVSDGYVAYQWNYSEERGQPTLHLEATGSGQTLHIRMLLPQEASEVTSVTVNGQPAPIVIDTIGTSRYVTVTTPADIAQVSVQFRR
jgi:hypothetical protein